MYSFLQLLTKISIFLVILTIFPLSVFTLDVTLNPFDTKSTKLVGPIPSYYTSLSIEWSYIRNVFLKNQIEKDKLANNTDLKLVVAQNLNMDSLRTIIDLGKPTFKNSTSISNTDNTNAGGTSNFAAIPSIVLIIGGSTSNPLYWQPNATDKLDSLTYPINELDLLVLESVAEYTKCQFVLTVGMPSPRPSPALGQLLMAFQSFISEDYIFGIGLGYQPERYADELWRESPYRPYMFQEEFKDHAKVISQYYPDLPIIGPSFSNEWLNGQDNLDFIKDSSIDNSDYFSFHYFGLPCGTTDFEKLMNEPSDNSQFDFVTEMAKAADDNDKTLVWSAGGPIGCGGMFNISHVFGAAHWTIDTLFEMASRGVKMASMSGTPETLNAPLTFNNDVLEVKPVYYGMFMFAIALGGSNTSVYKPDVYSGSKKIKLWATYNHDDGTHTLVIIHKERPIASENVATTETLVGDLNINLNIDFANRGGDEEVNGNSLEAERAQNEKIKFEGHKIEMTASSLEAFYGFSLAGISLGSDAKNANYKVELIQPDAVDHTYFQFIAKPSTITLVKFKSSTDKSHLFTVEEKPETISSVSGPNNGGGNSVTAAATSVTLQPPSIVNSIGWSVGLMLMIMALF